MKKRIIYELTKEDAFYPEEIFYCHTIFGRHNVDVNIFFRLENQIVTNIKGLDRRKIEVNYIKNFENAEYIKERAQECSALSGSLNKTFFNFYRYIDICDDLSEKLDDAYEEYKAKARILDNKFNEDKEKFLQKCRNKNV